MTRSFDAFLFDLDGTLVDTERESAEGIARFLATLNLRIDEADRRYVIGHSWHEIHRHLDARHGLTLSIEALIAGSAEERERVLAAGVRLLPGAQEILRRLHGRAPLGLVSGSSRRELDFSLRKADLAWAFSATLASEDYSDGKPSPTGYLGCAERLGVDPNRCVVFEDSAPGIAAAKAAGMRCVAIRAGNFAGHDQSHADAVVDSLLHVDDARLADLAADLLEKKF